MTVCVCDICDEERVAVSFGLKIFFITILFLQLLYPFAFSSDFDNGISFLEIRPSDR